jgi:methionyl-tRNA formyltransferase
MTKKDLRIVYMGTPDFAVASLKSLIENDFNVVGVITVADKPAGRGRKMRMSPVKIYAESQRLNVLQPTNLKDPEFIADLKAISPVLQIVVAFRMLPEVVWSLPKIGTFNLHASLLPQYRGAAPINWAIINGEKKTGLTTFFIEKQIDTGAIILQRKIIINPDDTAGELHERLMVSGAELVIETCNKILKERLQPVDQSILLNSIDKLKPAPKIFKADCLINWEQNTNKIYDFIRGLSPYPGAFCSITFADDTQKTLKVFNAEKLAANGPAGKISVINNKLIAYTKNGAIVLKEVQLEGKKRMLGVDFIRGVKLK